MKLNLTDRREEITRRKSALPKESREKIDSLVDAAKQEDSEHQMQIASDITNTEISQNWGTRQGNIPRAGKQR